MVASKKSKKNVDENIQMIIDEPSTTIDSKIHSSDLTPTTDLKRGRKPKGGKLIQKTAIEQQNTTPVSNVILHLRCSLKDLHCYYEKQNEALLAKNPLEYNPVAPPEIKAYDTTSNISFGLYNVESEKPPLAYVNQKSECCPKCSGESLEDKEDNINIKDLNVT